MRTINSVVAICTAINTMNVSLTPTALAEYGLSERKKVLRLIPATGYVCRQEDPSLPCSVRANRYRILRRRGQAAK